MAADNETIQALQQDLRVGEIHASALVKAKTQCEVEGIRLRLKVQFLSQSLKEMTIHRDSLLEALHD